MSTRTNALRVAPITLAKANLFVQTYHRHSRPVAGHLFAVSAVSGQRTVGVAIVGRPVSRHLDDGISAEITRVCTDGTRNACSILYGAARRAAKAIGYANIYTYTLPEEGGASLRAAGFRLDKVTAGAPAQQWHSRPGRNAQPIGDDLIGGKWRWVA